MQYRQNLRDLERLATWDGIIPRKRRRVFENFLSHPDARIRQYAQELATIDAEEREYQRAGLWPEDPDEMEICDSVATDEPDPDWFVQDIVEQPMQERTTSLFNDARQGLSQRSR